MVKGVGHKSHIFGHRGIFNDGGTTLALTNNPATATAGSSGAGSIGGGAAGGLAGEHTELNTGILREWTGVVPNDLRIPNPTAGSIRPDDRWGRGHYGARRNSRGGRHEGLDIAGGAGQIVLPPVVGNKFERIGGGQLTPNLTINQSIYMNEGIRITHPSGKFRVSYFHIDNRTGEILDPTAYGFPGMTPHVHVQLEQRIGIHYYPVNPTPFVQGILGE